MTGWFSETSTIKSNIWGYRWKSILYFRRHLTHFRWLYFSCVEIVFPRQDTGNLEDLEQVIMAITVTPKPGASTSNGPKNIGIVIEGIKVITGLGDIARACSVLLGLTYALNLDYPKYTFEVFQKPFLELDDSKLSNKVQSLKSKLQA
ncbi:hypothetical protein Q7C36_003799 [Tachysurus vachellii]|uniref:Uncharacterized protein n=1 Tax=Tachysurus vachellii TaxID=175792 RepID=A0AA88T9M4_TACVA|nr:hypothetical protein Q7C36_003799 [Tachysurus vachellii]